eukprot:CAMPEP_0204024756 /NCGR_PEP_ID=MMETSP0360-20130528/39671_1 /ASSEMBLY_ACC=CAM_ASM_000342 /TAXON_ID=268821 /ORGANISM="Scrippsiella Hangoei, Strain SHTV-5" /LENGTH=52 /DNA_ID=CAMNT_0050968277 /DNA_START=32 /DNA_END=186 /DNA_ORIENTATION=-
MLPVTGTCIESLSMGMRGVRTKAEGANCTMNGATNAAMAAPTNNPEATVISG